jgi:hypothetical protein
MTMIDDHTTTRELSHEELETTEGGCIWRPGGGPPLPIPLPGPRPLPFPLPGPDPVPEPFPDPNLM